MCICIYIYIYVNILFLRAPFCLWKNIAKFGRHLWHNTVPIKGLVRSLGPSTHHPMTIVYGVAKMQPRVIFREQPARRHSNIVVHHRFACKKMPRNFQSHVALCRVQCAGTGTSSAQLSGGKRSEIYHTAGTVC